MKPSALAIPAIWLLFLADAVRQGTALPVTAATFPSFSEAMAFALLIFPFLFFLVAAFIQRKRSFQIPLLTKLVDRRLGEGALSRFFARLRPTALFMVACMVLGFTGLLSTYFTTKSQTAFLLSGFFVSAGLGLLGAYMLSIRFPPRLT